MHDTVLLIKFLCIFSILNDMILGKYEELEYDPLWANYYIILDTSRDYFAEFKHLGICKDDGKFWSSNNLLKNAIEESKLSWTIWWVPSIWNAETLFTNKITATICKDMIINLIIIYLLYICNFTIKYNCIIQFYLLFTLSYLIIYAK